ncbi:MAG: alpha-amylase/4-alpha-glucanotransferase domain-containing protein, partial [Bacteroidota bacterium]
EGYHHKLLTLKTEKSSSSSESVASIHNLVLQKEENLGEYLTYDWYRRASLLDHFLGEGVTLDDFSRCKYVEQGDFVDQLYKHKVSRKGKLLHLKLWRDGHVWHRERHLPLRVVKAITLRGGSSVLEIEYELENSVPEPLDLWFGVEFSFALSAGDAPDRYYRFEGLSLDDRRLRSVGAVENVRTMWLVDDWLGMEIKLHFGQLTNIWRFPIETVSLSESGFERVYQGSVVFPNWRIRLEKKWKTTLLI